MTHAPTDVRLDPHTEDNSVVLARIGGPRANAARHILLTHTFRSTPGQGADVLMLVRIDREEAHYAEAATRALRRAGIGSELQQDVNSGWTWADYPHPSLTRAEIRAVGAEAQKVHDDIVAGDLVIHYHAPDEDTVVAVGGYAAGYSVHLHGEDHLRQVTRTFDNQGEALAEFDLLYGSAIRPGADQHPLSSGSPASSAPR